MFSCQTEFNQTPRSRFYMDGVMITLDAVYLANVLLFSDGPMSYVLDHKILNIEWIIFSACNTRKTG